MRNNIEYRWQIRGKEHYKITKEGTLFNAKTGRVIKRTVVGYTVGYWIGRKFYSLAALNNMAEKITPVKCPF